MLVGGEQSTKGERKVWIEGTRRVPVPVPVLVDRSCSLASSSTSNGCGARDPIFASLTSTTYDTDGQPGVPYPPHSPPLNGHDQMLGPHRNPTDRTNEQQLQGYVNFLVRVKSQA